MLTVLLATRNGAKVLPGTLDAFRRLKEPPSGWKIVIVDNGSKDHTREVIRGFEDSLPLKYLYEPVAGKNAALNTGLAHVEGDLAVFTDDDVFPETDWLVRLREAADAQPEYSMFGGAVKPRWEIPAPRWLAWAPPGPAFTLTRPDQPEGPIGPEYLFGPNLAIRSSVFADGVRFDASIGPRGSEYAMGSETELTCRLARRGHRAWYTPQAVVEHFVRKHQMRKSWVLKRALRFGRGQYRLQNDVQPETGPSLLGVRVDLLRNMLGEGKAMAKACLRFDEEGLFRTHWRFNFCRGRLIEARNLQRGAA